MSGDAVHLFLWHTAVLQRKGNILSHSQTDKLSVWILEYSAYMGRELKDAAVWSIYTVYNKRTGAFSGIGERVQTIDTACKRALATSRGAGNENTFSRINIQINSGQSWLFLGTVLK